MTSENMQCFIAGCQAMQSVVGDMVSDELVLAAKATFDKKLHHEARIEILSEVHRKLSDASQGLRKELKV